MLYVPSVCPEADVQDDTEVSDITRDWWLSTSLEHTQCTQKTMERRSDD